MTEREQISDDYAAMVRQAEAKRAWEADRIRRENDEATELLCCHPPGQDAGCGCRQATLPELVQHQCEQLRLARQEIAELQAIIEGLATRVAAQSELLARRAGLVNLLDTAEATGGTAP
jgi:hypothetical protein